MDERLRFVARLLDGEAMTDVCREFGISRKTGYKIFDRYREHGLEALTDRSRRPIRYANQLPGQVEGLIVSLKRDKPHWGARKIPELLVRRLAGDVRVPARSTRTRRIVFSIVGLDGDRKRFCFSNLRCRDKTSNRKFNFGFYTWGNSGLEPYSGSGNQLSSNRRGPPHGVLHNGEMEWNNMSDWTCR